MSACMLSRFSRVQLLATPWTVAHLGFSSVPGILQTTTLEWVAMPSSRGSSPPRDQTQVSYISFIDRWVLYHQCHLGSPQYVQLNLNFIKTTKYFMGNTFLKNYSASKTQIYLDVLCCFGNFRRKASSCNNPSSYTAISTSII